MDGSQIKPCPFCGNTIVDTENGIAYCRRCSAKNPVTIWNRRAPITREQVNEWCKAEVLVVVQLEPTEVMNYDGSVKLAQTTLAKLPETRTSAIYKAMIKAAQESS